MFLQWSDIVPILIILGSATLGIWGAFKSKETALAGKLISFGTALVFLGIGGLVYYERYDAWKHDYVSDHGMRVVQGEVNKCKRPDVEAWTSWTIDFWDKHYNRAEVESALKGKYFICLDEEKLSLLDRYVRGYATTVAVIIGWNGKLSYTRSLAIHEESHHVVYENGIKWGEKLHHDLFVAKKLGH